MTTKTRKQFLDFDPTDERKLTKPVRNIEHRRNRRNWVREARQQAAMGWEDEN